MEEYSVILFESNNYAMWCNASLKSAGLSVKLMSVPRHISSDCGYCLRIERSDREKALEIIDNEEIEFEDIVDI